MCFILQTWASRSIQPRLGTRKISSEVKAADMIMTKSVKYWLACMNIEASTIYPRHLKLRRMLHWLTHFLIRNCWTSALLVCANLLLLYHVMSYLITNEGNWAECEISVIKFENIMKWIYNLNYVLYMRNYLTTICVSIIDFGYSDGHKNMNTTMVLQWSKHTRCE